MPSALDQVLAVNITQATPAPATTSFGIPLIVGPTATGWAAGDNVHSYASPAAMLTDGYTTASPEYIAALAMAGQAVQPPSFRAGRRTTTVAQVDTLKVNTLTSGRTYTVTVNGVAYTYAATASDTQQSILAALSAAITAAQPLTGAVTGTGTSAVLTLTANVPGQIISYTAVDAQLTRTATTAANGLANDLTTIAAQDNTWYGLATPGAADADILQAAPWVEANLKLYVPVSATAAIAQVGTTDLGSQLKAAGYMRTGLFYSPTPANTSLGACLLGLELTQLPGSATWCYKTLPGMTADTLTATQAGILIGQPLTGVAGKNVNIYQSVGGVPVTQMGTAAAGNFFDVTLGLDWLKAQIQQNVYSALVSAAKVPMTDKGAALLIAAVRAAIDLGVQNGLVDGTTPAFVPTVTAPAVASLSTAQRAQRIGPPITFTCRLQGAQHAVTVAGTVTF